MGTLSQHAVNSEAWAQQLNVTIATREVITGQIAKLTLVSAT